MPFTPANAVTILNLLGGRNIAELSDGEVTAYMALRQFAASNTVNIYILVQPGQKIDGIKAIRYITEFGLKEAKDLYERLDPHNRGGQIGPIAYNVDREAAEMLKATMSGSVQSELILEVA